MRIGIYPGAFDPVHNGHIALARAALEAGELDRVIFLPEAKPRGKQRVTPLAQRLKMLALAMAGEVDFSVIALHSKQFTVVETLPELRGLFPNATLTLILGSDIVPSLTASGEDQWPDRDTLLEEVDLLIGIRGQDTAEEIDALMNAMSKTRYWILKTDHAHATSSTARQGQEDAHIPVTVAAYITETGLYV